MDKQEHEKPAEDLVSLPSIVPELDLVPNDLDPEIKRVFNLCWLGYSTAVYARDNRYSRHQRVKLITDFVIECDAALFSVSKLSKSFEGTIGNQERIDLFRDFEQFCQRLKKLVEDSISNNSAGFSKFYYLYFHSLSPLLQRMGLMSNIYAYTMNEALREGLEKWAKEHQDKHVEDPPKKRGATKKYTVSLLKKVRASCDKYYKESKDKKDAWNKAAKDHDIKSGKAAEMACRRYLKQNK